jgi:isoleucyl-tRNA synthetase
VSNTTENKYKDTIQLPKTDFPMRGNLAENEPKLIDYWEKNQIYQKLLKKNSKNKSFVLPDGPPYANGNIHLGHVLNKVLKDIVIKYKNLSGHPSAFIPGWDCHGLPIELNVTKSLGPKRHELNDKQIRDLCRKEATKWVGIQREQFKRLGILADWENPYLTLSPDYEAEEVRVLAEILDNGILVRGEKPVYWCTALQTALAAAEVEYHDHKSPSIYVKFYIQTKPDLLESFKKSIAFVIWTTTPWTLPANYAISLHPDFNYGVFECENEFLIFAEDLEPAVSKATQKEYKLIKTFKGSELEFIKTQHPFLPRESLVILGTHVTLEAGTGCVHTAPAHGMDDFNVGLKYKLPADSPVKPDGKYNKDFPEMEGIKIWDANPLIVNKLVESNHMLSHTEFVHSYPHNPRSKSPLIFRATPQWFIKMDDETYPLRKMALSAAEKDIQFVPDWGVQRLNGMLSNSPDWCVSRQRLWGVPIPVFYCQSCGEALANSKLMNEIADQMETSGKGIEIYHEKSAEEWTKNYSCNHCKGTQFTKGQDILDVWFDSGVCHTAVQKKRKELAFPADIYLEGSDQHRGWFQTSLVSSLAANGKSPFKALITHGFVNDSKGHKMSKSKGNVIDPAEITKKHGSEILRLWVAYEDYGQDVNIGNEMFLRITETYRRIRNTMRFLLSNLGDFEYSKDKIDYKDMPKLDQWALSRFNELVVNVTQSYESYNFYKVYHALNQFFTVELSATYLDILKDRLYTAKKDGLARRASQTVIYHLVNDLVVMMAPILTFLSEEVYSFIPDKNEESVLLLDFPKARKEWENKELIETFNELFKIRELAQQKLEDLRKERVIGSNLDAAIELTASSEQIKWLKSIDSVKEFFIVSQASIKEGKTLQIEVKKASGEKCIRCWHYSEEIGKSSVHPEICPKCIEALS